jgi:hypothetical protein
VARKYLYAVLALVAVLAFSGAARADSVGSLSLPDCGSGQAGCPAATYSFNITSTQATLTITITGAVTAGANDIISGVNLGFTPANNVSNLQLIANPGGSWTAVITDSLSNTGCGVVGNAAFVCASGAGVSIAQGGTYTWTWSYTLSDPSLIAAVGDVHIGANYDPHNGWIVSETGATTQTPEPASLALLGLGLLGLPFVRRRRS